jgi:TonB family protein
MSKNQHETCWLADIVLVVLLLTYVCVGLSTVGLGAEPVAHNRWFPTAPVSTPLAEWTRYTVKGEEFSVSLPALPAMTTRKIARMPVRKARIERVLGSYGEGIAYAIYTYENLQGQTLDEFIRERGNRRSRNREWTNPTDVTVNDFAGKQFALSDRGVLGAVQFFQTNNHLYQFEAVGAAIDDPRVQRFFTSLSLGKKVEGTEVDNGMGAQPSEDPDPQSSPTFLSKDVDQTVVVVTKPEPSYTESARQGQTTGAVVLKVVFASNGAVTNIQVISGLPFGLTEQAVAAAKQIRFVPALKNGQFVSTQLQLEYNFNLY